MRANMKKSVLFLCLALTLPAALSLVGVAAGSRQAEVNQGSHSDPATENETRPPTESKRKNEGYEHRTNEK
jgi:hypothetical protein